MQIDDLKSRLAEHPEFLKFEKVVQPQSKRADVHAFIVLAGLTPDKKRDIISGAEHDIIFLGVDIDELAPIITVEQVDDLARSGVFYSSEYDCLVMYV